LNSIEGLNNKIIYITSKKRVIMDYIYLIIGSLLTIATILNIYLIYRRPEGYGLLKTMKL